MDKIGSRLDDSIAKWLFSNTILKNTLIFPSMPISSMPVPGELSGALSLILFCSTVFDKALISDDTKLKGYSQYLGDRIQDFVKILTGRKDLSETD